jgi:serine kinase of HPr protein (carbohydrate metabolism regulator)
VALGGSCALLRGRPGAGKSDLALRFLFLPAETLGARPVLVADDQVSLRREGGSVVASCPARLAGRIEVRGAGIARIGAFASEARLSLIADLDHARDQPRFPQSWQWETVLGLAIRRIGLDPFELSAPVKLALALQNLLEDPTD